MVAGDVVHPDQEVVAVQVDPQNERNTAEEARPAVPGGHVVSLCGVLAGEPSACGRWSGARGALLGADAAAGQYKPWKLSGGVMGEDAGVNRLSGSVLKQVETGLCRLSGGAKSKAVGLCVGIMS